MLCLPIKGLNGECKNKRGGKHRKKRRRHTALDLEASIRFLSHAFVFSVRPAKPRYGFMCLLRVLRDRFPVLTIAREAAEAALAEAQKKCEQLKAELAQYPKNLVKFCTAAFTRIHQYIHSPLLFCAHFRSVENLSTYNKSSTGLDTSAHSF